VCRWVFIPRLAPLEDLALVLPRHFVEHRCLIGVVRFDRCSPFSVTVNADGLIPVETATTAGNPVPEVLAPDPGASIKPSRAAWSARASESDLAICEEHRSEQVSMLRPPIRPSLSDEIPF
jgi:hypothetical protein